MRVYITDTVLKDINNLFNRKVYLTDKNFCQTFIFYLRKISRDFSILKQGRNTYTLRNGFRNASLTAINVSYKVAPSINTVIVYSISFIGLMRLYRLCTAERAEIGRPLRRRPSHIVASSNVVDYEPSNLKGGTIGGIAVQVVKRKGVTTRSNKPVFNYLYNGRILSKYDFINPTPFSNYDGVEKAYADAANGYRYWILPTRRTPIRMYESTEQRILRIITEQINQFITRKCIDMQNRKCI